jgi:hypothetical protein
MHNDILQSCTAVPLRQPQPGQQHMACACQPGSVIKVCYCGHWFVYVVLPLSTTVAAAVFMLAGPLQASGLG